jgi:hypothetical protein
LMQLVLPATFLIPGGALAQLIEHPRGSFPRGPRSTRPKGISR